MPRHTNDRQASGRRHLPAAGLVLFLLPLVRLAGQMPAVLPPIPGDAMVGEIVSRSVVDDRSCRVRLHVSSYTESFRRWALPFPSVNHIICLTDATRLTRLSRTASSHATTEDLQTGNLVAVRALSTTLTDPAVAVAGSITLLEPGPAPTGPRLVERAVYDLPPDSDLTHVVPAGTDAFLLLSGVQGELSLLTGAGVVERVGLDFMALSLAYDPERQRVRVFDATNANSVSFGYPSLDFLDLQPVPVPGQPLAAAPSDRGWWVLVSDSTLNHRLVVYHAPRDEPPSAVFSLPPDSVPAWGGATLAPANHGAEAWVSSVRLPLRRVRLNRSSGLRQSSAGPDSLPEPPPAPSLVEPDWRAFPIVDLDGSRSLQTLVDVRSDHRWLLVYDSVGNLESRAPVHGPTSFIAVIPGESHLVAYRHVFRPQLVIYGFQSPGTLPDPRRYEKGR